MHAREDASIILTDRDMEVMCLVRKGYSNKQIGECLFISARTVDFRLQRLYEKLKVHNRIEAINKMTEMGLWKEMIQ
jgi:ATP/maltotriose-dependent transcriptional regulator MalT